MSTVNDTTNGLTTKIIFGSNRKPQNQFEYRRMNEYISDPGVVDFIDLDVDKNYTIFQNGKPIFPSYVFENGKSTYRDIEVGEGGLVYAKPGIYGYSKTFDVASMHPSSIIAENLFGDTYTAKFKALVEIRKAIKHKDLELVKKLFNDIMPGIDMSKYVSDLSQAKALSGALKIAINSVYGLTAAKFENPFRHPDNSDNIVAKRGALFMVNLKNEVERRGYNVFHIKTDSIKIENPDKTIEDFVMAYGLLYGYSFEIEHSFEKICLVNDAVYIAKCASDDPEIPGQWTATGTQFAVPYVFKTLFSKEPIEFDDLCETKSVSKGELYLDMNENCPDVEEYELLLNIHEKNANGRRLTHKEQDLLEQYPDVEDIKDHISKGHNYRYIGRVSRFCPMKFGAGGGDLYRCTGTKYAFAAGCKGYHWMESEMVRTLNKEDQIEHAYYRQLVDAAIDSINEFIPNSKFEDVDSFRA